MELEKNIYGLCEGVFKACQFLGLKFPAQAVDKAQPLPSDYFGEDLELDEAKIKKICDARKWKEEQFTKSYKGFKEKYLTQRCFKHTKTDLNVWFCDYALFSNKIGAAIDDYFDFEFYNKSFELRKTFRTHSHHIPTKVNCNDFFYMNLINDKIETNKFFADFIHRDWLGIYNCTFEEFKAFVEKHPKFFSKPFNGSLGKGAEIISVDSNANLKELFTSLKNKKRILEEIVIQHESLSEFCSNVVNTIRFYTILDVHNVVHILATSGRFGRKGGVVDNFHGGLPTQ